MLGLVLPVYSNAIAQPYFIQPKISQSVPMSYQTDRSKIASNLDRIGYKIHTHVVDLLVGFIWQQMSETTELQIFTLWIMLLTWTIDRFSGVYEQRSNIDDVGVGAQYS